MPLDLDLDRYSIHVRKLCDIALARLPRMIDPATGLCVFRVAGPELAAEGTSVRYTAIAALGLEQAEEHGLAYGADLARLYQALSATLAGVDDVGDVALVLWAAARRARPLAERALDTLLAFEDSVRRRGGATVHSTELAWVVTALAEALAANIGLEREVRARLDRAFRRLLGHRGASGLLCFARPRDGRPARLARGALDARLGFFDAQVYTITAALRRDAVVGDPEARAVAEHIGRKLLWHQHPLGQWAWHYDVERGTLVDLYPVYAVHQDGMAPMAMLALERALGVQATPAVARGLVWLFGGNEIGEPLALPERALIWRSIRRREPFRRIVYPLKLASLAGLSASSDLGASLASPATLSVDRELRPYHLGFCLYAFSKIASEERARAAASGPSEELESGERVAPRRGSHASNGA